jgi:hypothetical protein
MKRILPLFAFVILCQVVKAQQGFGTNSPAPSAVIDMVSGTKGALLPRVALTSTTVAAPVIAPADALTVFNTNTAGDVTPGYYYWSASPAPGKWVRLLTSFTQDLRLVGTASHITVDAGIGSNGTTMPGSHNIAIGEGAMKNVSVGPSPFGLLGNIAIGGGDQLAKVTGPSNIAIGYGNNPNGTGSGNIGIGGLNLTSVTTGEGNYAIGVQSQQAVTTGAQNISLGAGVLKASTGNKNIGMGNDVLTLLATGNDNVGFGVASGSVLTAGSFNTFFGTEAGNRILGAATERYTSGDFSLFLGSQTKAQNTVSNQLNIQNYIYGVNGSLAFGDFTGANALITPTARLDVTQGNVRVRDITAAYTLLATDKMVIADNIGVLRTVPTSSIAIEPWQVQGGTTKATANTDNIYQNGSVAIGIASGATIPSFTVGATSVTPKLHVEGDIATTGKIYTTNSVYADYVFEKYFNGSSKIDENYQFKSLKEVEAFIKANKHLPGVTPITEVNKTKNGYSIDMTKLSVQSLEKIEELYLYVIEQKDKIDQQQKEIETLKFRLDHLEKLLSKDNK